MQEESDNFELVGMLDEVKESEGDGSECRMRMHSYEYFSGEELKKAEENSYEVLVDTTIDKKSDFGSIGTEGSKDGSASRFEIWDFQYDASADVWILV